MGVCVCVGVVCVRELGGVSVYTYNNNLNLECTCVLPPTVIRLFDHVDYNSETVDRAVIGRDHRRM